MPMRLSSGEKGWGTAFMRMDYQKNQAGNSGRVTVAVVDSGIQRSHPVFSGKTILDLNWRKKYNLNVIAIIVDGHANATIMPDTVMPENCRVVLSGTNDALEKFRNVNAKGLG